MGPIAKLAALHVAALVLALTWLGNLPVLGGPPNLLLVLAIVIGAQYGWMAGAISGLIGGAMVDIWLGDGVSHLVGYALTAAGSGFISSLYLIRTPGGAMLAVFMATWLGELVMAAIYQYLGHPVAWEHWQQTTPWLALYNVLVTPLFFWLVGNQEEKRPGRVRPTL
jgi:hypothetical protein